MVIFSFFKNNLSWVEIYASSIPKLSEVMTTAIIYMTSLSKIKEKSILKTAADFWLFYTNYYR